MVELDLDAQMEPPLLGGRGKIGVLDHMTAFGLAPLVDAGMHGPAFSESVRVDDDEGRMLREKRFDRLRREEGFRAK